MTHRSRSTTGTRRTLEQRALVVAEVWTLAIWIGALVGFAFIFAPIAFRQIPDLDLFGALTTHVLEALAGLGYVCGGLAIGIAVLRGLLSHEPRLDYLRVLLFGTMLILVTYQTRAVVPAMETTARSFHAPFASIAKTDPRRVTYDALHRRSSLVYGAVLVLGFAAIALAALRPLDERSLRDPMLGASTR